MPNDWFKIAEFPANKDLSHLDAFLQLRGVSFCYQASPNSRALLFEKASDISRFKEFLDLVNVGVIDPEAPSSGVQRAVLTFDEKSKAKHRPSSSSGNSAVSFTDPISETKAEDSEELDNRDRAQTVDFESLSPEQRSVAFSTVNSLLLKEPKKAWISIVFIVLGLAGWAIAEWFLNTRLFYTFTFLPIEKAVPTGQFWRPITPAFLHFGIVHIVFNGLWMWLLGARIERFTGKWVYVGLFAFTALVGNYTQFLMEPRSLFGGLSGVVYGYLGFLLILNRRLVNPLLYIMPSLSGMMLLFLGLGMFGVLDLFLDGSIANGAHLGGLVAGLVFGGVYAKYKQISPESSGKK